MAFEYLAAYKTFESVAEMDKSVEDHISAHYYDLTDSERAVVFTIASRSLMYPGASHLKAATIAETLEISTKTVYRSIKRLAELGIIEKVPGTKLNGIKGASIYKILPFDCNVPTEVSQRVTEDEASNDAAHPPQSENQSFSSFNHLSSKQASNIISAGEELVLKAEKKKEFMNELQVMLFDFLHSLPMCDELKDQLHNVVLASRLNDTRDFVRAKNVMLNIVRDIHDGVLTVTSTLRAVFSGAFSKAEERAGSLVSGRYVSVVDKPRAVKPAPFYNWLEDRG
ncbi:hypothetical protein NCCP2716_23680 [Sporosarcina sp. NCCP-2716]|nr:hypothetical protein NCCP2716_23680 [Sporosarcina sp. NCCP-2716]